MTKLEELKAAREAAWVAAHDAEAAAFAWDGVACDDAHDAVWDAYKAARDAYEDELDKNRRRTL